MSGGATASGGGEVGGGSRMTLRVGHVHGSVAGDGRAVIVWQPRREVVVRDLDLADWTARYPPCACAGPRCPDRDRWGYRRP